MKKRIEYILDNGWIVYEDDSGKGFLHVEPLQNSLFKRSKIVQLPDNIFKDIKSGLISIKELFQKHNLHNLIIEWETPAANDRFVRTETQYYGRGYNVCVEKNKYYLLIQLSSHGGGSRKFEITQEVFEYAQNDSLTVKDILDRFNLHHLDVPENDVK
jgi:hypothetical protein